MNGNVRHWTSQKTITAQSVVKGVSFLAAEFAHSMSTPNLLPFLMLPALRSLDRY